MNLVGYHETVDVRHGGSELPLVNIEELMNSRPNR